MSKVETLARLMYAWQYYGLEEEEIKEADKSWDKCLDMLADKNMPWINGGHMGDCTNEPNTCMRCLVEDVRADAELFMKSHRS